MQKCPHCELEAAPNADTCPRCGHSFLKERLREAAEKVGEKVLDAAGSTFWSIYMLAFHAGLIFGFFYGLGKIYELAENPFGGRIDSEEQALLWLFLLVVPCALMIIYQSYQFLKEMWKKHR